MEAARYPAAGANVETQITPNTPVTAGANPWAGVMDPDDMTYSGIQGSWVVPSPFKTDGNTRYAAQWVGDGGAYGSGVGGQLVQAGSMVVTAGSAVSYYTWFEVYPDQPHVIQTPVAVTAGQTIFVDISAGTTQSYIYLENESTGAYDNVPPADTAAGCTCPSAEAINENPGSNTNLMAFTNEMHFSNDAATTTNGDEWINSIPWTAETATDSSGNTLAYASGLTGDGDFAVIRTGND